MKEIADALYNALQTTLISSCEIDANGESATIVDALFRIGDAINNVAMAIRESKNED